MSPTLERPLKPGDQQSYLLRIRYESDGSWRVMLQSVRTRASYGFQDLAEAFAFIESMVTDGEKL
jgi:hypothetical protein